MEGEKEVIRMPYGYIRASGIRQLVKENGKRCGKDFLQALDIFVKTKVERCCKVFNGHKATLDENLIYLTK